MGYLDIHTHLLHPNFPVPIDRLVDEAEKIGLTFILSNGTHPSNNKETILLASQHAIIYAAAGIYPVDAAQPKNYPHLAEEFDPQVAISQIEKWAQEKEIIAIGECGLDGHWLDQSYDSAQEDVFVQLIGIAQNHDLPLIVHSRKKEQRVLEILDYHQAKRVNMHCYNGKTSMITPYLEKNAAWTFSVPANIERDSYFQKLVRVHPLDFMLTETDAPFLSRLKGQPSTPLEVPHTIQKIASIHKLDAGLVQDKIADNLGRLFGKKL